MELRVLLANFHFLTGIGWLQSNKRWTHTNPPPLVKFGGYEDRRVYHVCVCYVIFGL